MKKLFTKCSNVYDLTLLPWCNLKAINSHPITNYVGEEASAPFRQGRKFQH